MALSPAQSITLGLKKWRDVTAQKHFNTDTVCLRAAGTLLKIKNALFQSCKWV